MKFTFLTFTLLLSGLVCLAGSPDSLRYATQFARARVQMNMDATYGRKVLDSLWTELRDKPDETFFRAEYHKLMGVYYFRISKYDSCLWYYAIAGKAYNELGNQLEQAKIRVNTAMVHNRMGEFDKAIEMAMQAVEVFEKIGEKKGIGISLNIAGQVCYQTGSYERSKTYFRKYLQNAAASRDTVELASAYANLGSSHYKLGALDSSLYYYRRSFVFHTIKKNIYGIGNAYQNIASTHKDLYQPDSAFHYYQKAHASYTQVNNKAGLAETSLNIGKTYNDRREYRKALGYLTESLEMAQQINELFIQQEALKSISLAYEMLGEMANSLAAYKRYDLLSDSIFNIQKSRNIEELNTRYETGKKEQEIVIQRSMLSQQQAELQRNYILLIGSALLLISALIISVLLRNRLRRKNELLRKEHEISLRETYIQASLQSQEDERRRFARDLHDGMGQLISSLKIAVSMVREGMSLPERVEVVQRSEKILNEMHHEIRGIAFNLMPQTLIQSGLRSALSEMASRLQETGKVRVEVRSFDMPDRLAEIHEISLYRIAQEWVNNIIKYAGASVVKIEMVGHEHEITIMIEDDGKGFEPGVLESGKGNGWKNIQSRLRLIKGSCYVDSAPERNGSSLIITVPVEPSVERKSDVIEQAPIMENTH